MQITAKTLRLNADLHETKNVLGSNQSSSEHALNITQKPYYQYQYDKAQAQFMVGSGKDGDALQNKADQNPQFRQKVPKNSVLMLTQETQTENRILIKQILTLINEAMMKQLESKSLQMSKEEFDETVAEFKLAIPSVYDQIKKKSESYFIEAGPSAEVLAQN